MTSFASIRSQIDAGSTHMMSIWCCFDVFGCEVMRLSDLLMLELKAMKKLTWGLRFYLRPAACRYRSAYFRPSCCMSALFDHFPVVRFQQNRSRRCIFKKVTSGHRFWCRPKSGLNGVGDKMVILVHFCTKSIFSYSVDRRVLKMHRYIPSDCMQKMQEAEFWIFALKVR